MPTFDINNLDGLLVFRSRPEATPADLRPLWRICVIILILELASRGQKSSFSKLHVLNWAIRSKENRQSLRQFIKGKISPDSISVRIEPSLNRAVDFAYAEGIIEFVGGKNLRLTFIGANIAKKLMDLDNIFTEEKLFLQEIGKNNLTELAINDLFLEGN